MHHPSSTPAFTPHTLLTLLVCLWPGALLAQTLPTLHLEDNVGTVLDGELTIGRSLLVRLDGAQPGATYRLTLTSRSGDLVDRREVRASASGATDTAWLFYKSHIWTDGCPTPDDGPSVGAGGGKVGPFASLPEAGAALDGEPMWLSVEIAAGSATDRWLPLLSEGLTMVESEEAIYYWSDAAGYEKCYFPLNTLPPAGTSYATLPTRDKVYLSVYKGHLEPFTDSRVYMLQSPNEGDDWSQGYVFEEARYRESCQASPGDDCSYHQGSAETLPQTTTVEMRGLLPKTGSYIAVVRDAAAPQGTELRACDRVTPNTAWFSGMPHVTESRESWGCPPCED